MRFYFAFLIVLDKPNSAWQALCKSWKMTKGKMNVLFPVVLFVLIPNMIAWAVNQNFIMVPGLFAIILWIAWWIVNSFFLLIMSRAYVLLNRA